jgi:prefoldin subunit 5
VSGTDQACTSELNRQIQGLQARLSQTENNITSMYYGMSTLVAALAETPAEAAAAVMAPFYNFTEVGFALVQKFIDLVDPKVFKALMMEMALGLVEGMAAELDALIGSVVASLNALVSGLNAAIAGLNAQIAAINAQIAAGGLTPEQLADLTGQKNGLLADLADQMARLDKALDMAATAPSLLGAQKNAASCRTISLLLSAPE